MKFTKVNDQQMVMKQTGYASIIFGGIFILIGFFLLYVVLSAGGITSSFTPLIFPGFFLIMGLLVIVLVKFSTITIDKNNIQVVVKRLFGSYTKSYAVSNIEKLEMREVMENDVHRDINTNTYRSSQYLKYQLAFLFKDGTVMTLDGMHSSGFSFNMFSGRDKERELGMQIASFLHVPFSENSPTNTNPIPTMPGGIEIKL